VPKLEVCWLLNHSPETWFIRLL